MAIQSKTVASLVLLRLHILHDVLQIIAGTTILALGLGLGIQDGLLNLVQGFFENMVFAVFGFLIVILSHTQLLKLVDQWLTITK